ncbi:MAG: hypothetical protein D6788_07255 [Planctomycetota bacterium]|nr:MAG: hypothetical protein D6788_07255 [Planctomycetota bacterium]
MLDRRARLRAARPEHPRPRRHRPHQRGVGDLHPLRDRPLNTHEGLGCNAAPARWTGPSPRVSRIIRVSGARAAPAVGDRPRAARPRRRRTQGPAQRAGADRTGAPGRNPPELLIADDFGLRRLDGTQSADIYEVIIERHKRTSTIAASNRTVDEWIPLFDDPMLAQSTLDRLAHNARQLAREGESDRKRQAPGTMPRSAQRRRGAAGRI